MLVWGVFVLGVVDCWLEGFHSLGGFDIHRMDGGCALFGIGVASI